MYSVIGDALVYDNMDGEALRDGHLSLKKINYSAMSFSN
jgi:hypothetical protein